MAPPKPKGLKMTLHELGRALRVEDDVIALPSQSSGIVREKPDLSDWGRGERGGDIRSDDRRGAGSFGGEDLSDDINWRSTGNSSTTTTTVLPSRFAGNESNFGRGGDEEFNRTSMQSRSELSAAAAGGGNRIMTRKQFEPATRRIDVDVDFGTARERSSRSSGIVESSRTPISSNTNNNLIGVETVGPWRNHSTTPSGRIDTRPEGMRLKYKLRPSGTSQQLPTPITDNTDKSNLSVLNDVEIIPTPSSEPVISSILPSVTTKNNSDKIVDSVNDTTPEVLELSVPQPTVTADISELKTRPSEVVDNRTIKNISSTVDAAPISTTLINSTESIPIKTTVGSSSTVSAPWRPSRLRGTLNRSGGCSTNSLDELVQQKVAEKTAAVVSSQLGQSTTGAEVDEVKIAYRKNLQEKEQKKKEEEERKRQEKLETERLAQIALEQLMLGNSEKIEHIQVLLEKSLQENANSSILLERFKNNLTMDDMKSLVPSIVIAKCLILQTIEKLKPTICNNSSISSAVNNDIQLLHIVSQLTIQLKPVLQFVFSVSGIRRHKLRFLVEIQRFLNVMKFPRLSEGLSLIEAIWDSLYMNDIIEEQYFNWWYDDTEDDTPGRANVLFQMLGWFEWLHSAPAEGEEIEDVLEAADDSDDDDDL